MTRDTKDKSRGGAAGESSKPTNFPNAQYSADITLPRVDVVVEGQRLKKHLGMTNNTSYRTESISTDVYRKDGGSHSITMSHKSHASSSSTESVFGPAAYQTNAHTLSTEQFEEEYRTDIEMGLGPEVAVHLMEKYGPNVLTPPEKESELIKLLKHVFCGIFNILLWAACCGQVTLYILFADTRDKLDLIVPAILATVVVTAGVFQWYQERNSEQIMQSFANMVPQSVSIIRSGQMREVNAAELVPGDLVLLTAGEKIPADVRIVECTNDMQVDNASLTGESEPQTRSCKCTHHSVMETQNVAFFGTLVLKGRGKGVVFNTGDSTLLGKIASLAGGAKKVKTTFAEDVEHFVKLISYIAIGLGLFCGTYDLAQGKPFKSTLYFAISIIIANIPEGLIPTVSLALTLSAKRMIGRKVLVRNLEAIETLGSVSVICSDKTGTLTTGVMTVSHLRTDVTTRKFKARTEQISASEATNKLTRAAILCNNAQIQENLDGSFDKISGFPTETGLFRASMECVGGTDAAKLIRQEYPTVHEIPFNSDNKWQLSIHQVTENGSTDDDNNQPKHLITLKGAPERVLDLCGWTFSQGKLHKLTEDERSSEMKEVMAMAALGERVLCFAEAIVDPLSTSGNVFNGDNFDTANWTVNGVVGGKGEMTFLGFMSMVDPPRDSVPEAIKNCNSAGIKVVMVTGDHKVTAAAIAKQIGIIAQRTVEGTVMHSPSELETIAEDSPSMHVIDISPPKRHIVVTGDEIQNAINKAQVGGVDLIDQFWSYVLSFDSIVFARTSPVDKMIIVQEFQKRGMVVAVTGDGVNDAPALNQAHVGVAMGINGTDVAREAADIILLDDNFASIVNGVEEGRLIADNLKKSIAYTLCSKLPQIAPTLARNLLGLPLAMTMMQIILIDLGTDIWTGVAMAYEEKEDKIMDRKPRNLKKDPMVSKKMLVYSYLHIGILQAIACFFAYFHVMYDGGRGINLPAMMWNNPFNMELTNNWGTVSLFCYSGPNFCEHNSHLRPDLEFSHHLSVAQQTTLLRRGQTAFYVTLILMQICAAICCQTRIASALKSGLKNVWLNFCFVFEIGLGLAVVYTPTFQGWFEMAPLEASVWFTVIPFMFMVFGIEEFRKYTVRQYPIKWGKTLLW